MKVLDIVPNKNSDDVIMILHEYDYDVSKTIEFLLDGGDLTQDWKTAGKQNKKQNASPNQTLEDIEKTNNHQQKSNKSNKNETNGHGNDERKNGQRTRGDKNNRSKSERNSQNRKNENNKENRNNHSLEDKLNGLDIQDDQNNSGY